METFTFWGDASGNSEELLWPVGLQSTLLWSQALVSRHHSLFSWGLILGHALCGARKGMRNQFLPAGANSRQATENLTFLFALIVCDCWPCSLWFPILGPSESPRKALVKPFPCTGSQASSRNWQIPVLMLLHVFYLQPLSLLALDFKTRCYVKILGFAVAMSHI